MRLLECRDSRRGPKSAGRDRDLPWKVTTTAGPVSVTMNVLAEQSIEDLSGPRNAPRSDAPSVTRLFMRTSILGQPSRQRQALPLTLLPELPRHSRLGRGRDRSLPHRPHQVYRMPTKTRGRLLG